MATSASVWLMTIEPPDFSHTLLLRALSSSDWTPYSSKIGYGLSCSFTRADIPGMMRSSSSTMRACSRGSSMRMAV